MSISISGHVFDGPFFSKESLKTQSGVYAILSNTSGNGYSVVDCGESGDVKDRVKTHDRESCWKGQTNSPQYAAHYTPGKSQEQRKRIEKQIRDEHNPPCGKQ